MAPVSIITETVESSQLRIERVELPRTRLPCLLLHQPHLGGGSCYVNIRLRSRFSRIEELAHGSSGDGGGATRRACGGDDSQ